MKQKQRPCTLHLTTAEKLILLIVFFGLLSGMFANCSPKMTGYKTKNGCGVWYPKKFKA